LRARRRSAPFGWDRHPFTLGLTHAPTRTTQPALPAAVGWRRQLAAGTEASRRHEAGSESYRDGAPLRAPRGARLGWAPSCACESADAPLAVHLAALCPSRLLAVTTSPSRCAVRPPGQGCGRPRRAIDVHTSEDVGASKGSRWLLFCNQQFSMSTRESLDFRSARAEPPTLDLAPGIPLRCAGRCFVALGRRRRAVVSARRTRMTAQLGHAADRGLEASHPGAVHAPGSGNPRVDFVGSRGCCCAGRMFCGPVPRFLATDAPAHHPPPSFWDGCG
jgi:hypothetical protein